MNIKILAASILLLGFSNLSSAGQVVSCDTAASWNNGTFDLDYGNATDQASSACHNTQAWQKLGTDWNSDTPTSSETDLSTNDGVSWKTSSDGGNTWGNENGEFTAGDLVQFQFDVTRAATGNHKYDLLKSWVDWNQDGLWDESEDIISQKWWKNEDSEGNATSGSQNRTLNKNNDLSTWKDLGTANGEGSQNRANNWWKSSEDRWRRSIFNSNDTTATFFSAAVEIPVLDALKDIWLRARVVCENSLQQYAESMNLISTGYQHQGEVEDYQLTIAKAAKPPGPVPVPEPSTLLIFAIGLLALRAQRQGAK